MTGKEVITAMSEGFTLHSSFIGFWLISPHDSRCINLHNGVAKSIIRKRLIRYDKKSDSWIKARNPCLPRGFNPPLPPLKNK